MIFAPSQYVRKIGNPICFVLTMFTILIASISTAHAEIKKLQVQQVETPPVIDGVLDDPCWQTAPKGEDFTLRGFDIAATEQTEFYVCFDENNLYFGFHCFDSQPDKIVANQKERDGDIWNDDFIVVVLDTYHQHRNVDEFSVTAIGTQYDERGIGTAEKIEWKGDWFAAATIVSDGWTAEMQLPFSILNYNADQTSMGLNVYRNQERLDEGSDWSKLESGGHLTEYGDIEGLILPKSKKKPVVIMPYLLSIFSEDATKGRFGFDLKHQLKDDDTILFSAFPDFGYIESAVKRIDFTYTTHRYWDNRPFFQEASSIFSSPVFNSSLVPNFDCGLKIFGRENKWEYGLMGCAKFGDRTDTFLTAEYSPSSKTDLRVHMTSRDDDVNNKVLVFESDNQLNLYDSLWFKCAKSFTSGAEKNGSDYSGGFFHYKNPFNFYCSFQKESKYFNPASSYNDYPGTTSWYVSGGYDTERLGKQLRSYGFGVDTSRCYDDDHGLISKSTYTFFNAYYANHVSCWISRYWGPHIANYDAEPGTPYTWNNDVSNDVSVGFKTNDQYRSGRISYAWGRTGGGPSKSFRLSFGFVPFKKLSSKITFQHVKRDNPSEGSVDKWLGILNAKYEITPEKSLSARLVRQEEGTNLTVSYRQQVRKGLDIYALFGDYNEDHTKLKLSVKLVLTI